MTFHPDWFELDHPLPRCPRSRCRREQTCCNAGTDAPCLRTHESRDAMYFRMAAELRAFTAASLARDAAAGVSRAPLPPYEVELRLKAFKEALEAREREFERTGR